jgi:DUF4097 and DUF4098 domain-containing protein YvlB
MSDRTETYDVEPNVSVVLRTRSGDIRFKKGDEGRVVIGLSGSADGLSAIEIDAAPDTVTVSSTGKKRRWMGTAVDTVVTLPVGSNVLIHSGAGDVAVGVDVNELEIHTGAGDVRADRVNGVCDIKLGSGDVRLGQLVGTSRVSSGAGDIRIDSSTESVVSSAAGDIDLGDVTESARVRSAAGNVRVRKFSGSDLEIKTMSGDVIVGLVRGMVVNAAIKTLSGDLRNRIKPTPGERVGTMNLTVTSFSGDVILKSAK